MSEQEKDLLQAISEMMDSKLEPIRKDVSSIKVKLENEIEPNIRLLAEGHTGLSQKLKNFDKLEKKVEEMHHTVSGLVIAVKEK